MTREFRNDYCEIHAQIPAIAVCEICGTPVCGDCAVTQNGVTLCHEGSHSRIAAECRLLGRTQTLFDADLIARNLESRAIRSHRFGPLTESEGAAYTMFVPTERFDESISVIRSLYLIDFITLEHHV
jgi:sulfur transfer complex TusBCD TusB component (DsrH family)